MTFCLKKNFIEIPLQTYFLTLYHTVVTLTYAVLIEKTFIEFSSAQIIDYIIGQQNHVKTDMFITKKLKLN